MAEEIQPMCHRLEATGLVSRNAAQAAVNAPFPHLAALLLHLTAGEELPEWMTGRWLDPAFQAHIRTVYTGARFDGNANGVWSKFEPRRPVMATLLAEHGQLTWERLQELVGAQQRADWDRIAKPDRRVGRTQLRLWSRADDNKSGIWSPGCIYEPLVCSCGDRGRIVVRAAEVIGGLLCRCGRIVNAGATGVDPDLRFPAEYMALELPLAWGVQMLRDEIEVGAFSLTSTRLAVLQAMSARPTSINSAGVAAGLAATSAAAHSHVNTLHMYGLIEQDYSQPVQKGNPTFWKVTPLGRLVLAELAISGPRATAQNMRRRRRDRNDGLRDARRQSEAGTTGGDDD